MTLNHWDQQIPLSLLNPIAHIKVSPSEGALGDEMADELRGRGFHVIQTVADWGRGMSHQSNYMTDLVTVSKEKRLYERPYYLHCEDDSPLVSERVSLEDLLLQSCRMLAEDHELQSVRVARRGDARGPTVDHHEPDPRFFYSLDVNLQPLILRSTTFYQLGLWLERNPALCEQVQCEALIRMILDQFSRTPYRHAVWETSHAHSPHLGVPQAEHEAALRLLGLTPLPAPLPVAA